MLSAEADHAMVGRAIAEGASGYVGKEKPIVEIVEMLDRAVRGQLAVEPIAAAARPAAAQGDGRPALGPAVPHRPRVAGHAVHHGRARPPRRWPESLGVQRSTARTHVQNLLTKLGVHSRLQAAALMSAHGSTESWPVHLR